jgi:hypothetical protein
MSGDLPDELRDIAAEWSLRHLQGQLGHPTPLREAADEIERLRAQLVELGTWRRWYFERTALLVHLIAAIDPPPIAHATEPDGVTADGVITVTDSCRVDLSVEIEDVGSVAVAYGADSDFAAALAAIAAMKDEIGGGS